MRHDTAERDHPVSRRIVVLALAAGVVLRVLLVAAAPRFGYAGDHFDVIGMGVVAEQRGVTRVYSVSKDELPTFKGRVYQRGQPTTIDRPCQFVPNYPPLCMLLFWAQSAWLGAADPGFVANTLSTRVVTSLVPWLFEVLTALGVASLAAAVTGSTPMGTAAGIATWLAPPLMMNAALFGQYDALVVGPGVLAVLALVRERWAWAGVWLGLGLLLKPQGLLMAPIAAFAACLGAAGLGPVLRRLVTIGAAALVTVVVGSAPWMLAEGLAWVQRCYRMNFVDVFPVTTLQAFNLWFLVGLVAERQPVFDILSSTVEVAGLSRDAWGRLLLAGALAATAAVSWWRYRRRPALALVLFAGLTLWAIFIWPTRVHERYILYCVPLMIVAAAALPRLRAPVAILLLVATMEHSWMVWEVGAPLGSFDRRVVDLMYDEKIQAYWKDRPVTIEAAKAAPKQDEVLQLAFDRHRAARGRTALVEWALTLLSLGAYAVALGVVARGAPPTR